MLSAAATLGDDRVLDVVGTPDEDRVNLRRTVANGKDEIRVALNGERFYFKTADVDRVVVDLGAGDDRVTVDRDSAMFKTSLSLWGDGGDDTLAGAGGDDLLMGGDGDDELVGGPGHDRFDGGDGEDDLWGGRGNDRLSGGAGNDALVGGNGNDQLSGGSGADLFVFGKGGGEDVVSDFQLGVDRLVLTDGIAVKNAFVADVDRDGVMDLVITFTNGGGAVALLGVTNFAGVGFAGPDALNAFPAF